VVADLIAQRSRTVRNLQAVGSQPLPEPQRLDAEVVGQVVVADALASLGEPRRTIVRLAVVEERTHDEISRELGLALGTVKSHVRRGLLQLRGMMERVENGAS
jgi:RNA polymerase sigma-70 factor (ECF subfamily)